MTNPARRRDEAGRTSTTQDASRSLLMKKDGSPKKNRPPKSPWVSSAPWAMVLLVLLGSTLWLLNRPTPTVTITYGELLEILQNKDSDVRFEDVKIGATEIRGKIITSDVVS